MDAAEDDKDVKLQKLSSAFVSDFEHSLTPFLYRPTAAADGAMKKVRRKVRAREADRLVALLEPFQELPQLLDPHLGRFLPVLADACSNPREKVVVRFLGAETRNLELLLAAVEGAEAEGRAELDEDGDKDQVKWTWEERYICLLWLSHLLLAPFDLANISSAGTQGAVRPEIPNLEWPGGLPSVAERVIPLAVKYLGAAGKERDAAKALLVRISMRRDMQELGLLHVLTQWAMACLKSPTTLAVSSSYYYIGMLSYLAGILNSSLSTADMDPYLLKVFRTVQNISDEDNVAFKTVHASAIARKMVIKVLRTIGVLALREEYSSRGNEGITNEIVESTIGYFLDALSDADTPVRLAASKALSVITLKLPPDLATQVVSAVLDSLDTNVLWQLNPDGTKTRDDLSAVNPQEWHGLILTLSHFLYRKSAPQAILPAILHALLIGLIFERRSASGSSIGTNVRDAACFGIWALARRYTTAELQDIDTVKVDAAKLHMPERSIIQVLATELVVAASLDSAGNIRRGASAALQELIGRHPDIVAHGITVVQVVDYHAVALRSRAILEVAPAAALLSQYYADALLRALFGWRGVGSGDAGSRRTVAGCVKRLVEQFGGEKPWQRAQMLVEQIGGQLGRLKTRAVEERHGLVLAMAGAATALPVLFDPEIVNGRTWVWSDCGDMLATVSLILQAVLETLQSAKASTSRRLELGSEATCKLIVAACPIIRMAKALQGVTKYPKTNLDGSYVGLTTATWKDMLHSDPAGHKYAPDNLGQPPLEDLVTVSEIIEASEDIIDASLRLADPEAIEAAVAAATGLTLILTPQASESLIHSWIHAVTDHTISRARQPGYLFALANVFKHTHSQDEICNLILAQWHDAKDIGSRVSLLQCLNRGSILGSHAARFIPMIAAGLDDYTTDARGDIGSLARIEALKATAKVFATIPRDISRDATSRAGGEEWFVDQDNFGSLYGRTLRLAAEKLDKVRAEAHSTLALLIQDPFQHTIFTTAPHASRTYFRWLLDLQTPTSRDWLLTTRLHDHSQWSTHLFDGYVSAADSGAESLIRVSRAALDDFCDASAANRDLVCAALVGAVKRLHGDGNERVLIPTMSMVGFLFDADILDGSSSGGDGVSFKSLFAATQRAHFKSGSVRKLEVAVRIYGGLLGVGTQEEQRKVEVLLVRMLRHPFPAVRAAVGDVLWVWRGVGKGGLGGDDLKRALEERWEKLGVS